MDDPQNIDLSDYRVLLAHPDSIVTSGRFSIAEIEDRARLFVVICMMRTMILQLCHILLKIHQLNLRQ